jgi:hypothetical protein
MGQISRCRIGAAARIVRSNELRPVQVQRDTAAVAAVPLISCLSRSWTSGTSFFSDPVMQDSWWRLIVYFDVIGMVATRGAPFDSFFSSEHTAAFSAVIQVNGALSSPSLATPTLAAGASGASRNLQRLMACRMLSGDMQRPDGSTLNNAAV